MIHKVFLPNLANREASEQIELLLDFDVTPQATIGLNRNWR
jgi:hypothetical protein